MYLISRQGYTPADQVNAKIILLSHVKNA